MCIQYCCYTRQDFNQSERMVCLIREISSSGLLLTRQSTKKSKVADNKVTILGPGNMTFKTGHAQKSGIEDNIPLSDRLEPVSKPVSFHPIFRSIYFFYCIEIFWTTFIRITDSAVNTSSC